MNLSKDIRHILVAVIGAGGSGGYILPHLYRIASVSDYDVRIVVCDGDVVESKNLVRQNFIYQDISLNKAMVLSRRYAGAFGMETEFIPSYIESVDNLLALGFLTPYKHGIDQMILVGAVDNNKTRQICHELFNRCDNLIYIDAGNAEQTGQVVCGVRRHGRTIWKPAAGIYPDILDDTDKLPTELSCAEMAESAPQSVTANLMAATIVTNYLYKLLITGSLDTRYVTFSTNLISARPTLVKKPNRRKPKILPFAA